MDLIGFFDVPLTFNFELFDKLLDFILAFFYPLLERHLGLIILSSFSLEPLHFSTQLKFAIFNVQSKRLNIPLVLFLNEFVLLGKMFYTFLHLDFHLIFFSNLTVLEIGISFVLFVFPDGQFKRFSLLLEYTAQLLHLFHIIGLLFADYLELFLHDVMALLKFNRNFPILINLLLHPSDFFTLLIKHLFLLFVSFFELSHEFHLLGLCTVVATRVYTCDQLIMRPVSFP